MQILVIILLNLHSYHFLNIQKTIVQSDKVDFYYHVCTFMAFPSSSTFIITIDNTLQENILVKSKHNYTNATK
jgi:hypothetical protein